MVKPALFFAVLLLCSCSGPVKRNSVKKEGNDYLASLNQVDSSGYIKIKYSPKDNWYAYHKEAYIAFEKWFNELNPNYICEPDAAHEIYIKTFFKEKNKYDKVRLGPDFFYLYAYLLKKKNGVAPYAKMREKYVAMLMRVNALHRNLNADSSYIYFQFQGPEVAAYTEFAIYSYRLVGKSFEKEYNIEKQKSLYLAALRQKVSDELQGLEKVEFSDYAHMDEKQKKDLNSEALLLIDEIGKRIESYYDLKVVQKFDYTYY